MTLFSGRVQVKKNYLSMMSQEKEKEKEKEKNNVYKIFTHYAKDDALEQKFSDDIKASLEHFEADEEKKDIQKKQQKKQEQENQKTKTNQPLVSDEHTLVLELEKKKMPFWLEMIINIVVIAVLFTLVRTFIFVPFNVDGSSMEGTLHDGEFIYVDKATSYFREYERGDTVVFIPPYTKVVREKFLLCKYHTLKNIVLREGKVDPCMVQASFVKRVIGIEGDVVEIKQGHVYLTPKGGKKQEVSQDFLLEENTNKTCLPALSCQNKRNFEGKIYPPVPKGKYFVLGDNRRNSSDSRESSWDTPFVEGEKIVGIVRAVFLSPQKITIQEQMLLQQENAFMRTLANINQVFQGFSNTRILHQQKIISE